MKRLLAVIAVALALPAGAGAKGPVSAEICGPNECRPVPVALAFPHLAGSSPPPAPGPYNELRLDYGNGSRSSGVYYEPRSGSSPARSTTGRTARPSRGSRSPWRWGACSSCSQAHVALCSGEYV